MRLVATRADWVDRRRRDAWHFGRNVAADLTERYRQRYRLPVAPPPAKVVYELLTDFVGASLSFDPLPPDRFAQTRWVRGVPHVTINSRTDLIEGVKDVEGVQHVACWHELIHVVEDRQEAISEFQQVLPGLDQPAPWICYRDKRNYTHQSLVSREFRAEEAGRAAAISVWALNRLPSWLLLVAAGEADPSREVKGAWPRLYHVAADLGVNISALVKQLEYDGLILIERTGNGGGGRVFVPARLFPQEQDE